MSSGDWDTVSMTFLQRIILATLALAGTIIGGAALYAEHGGQDTTRQAAQIPNPTTSASPSQAASGADGGACALISAALDRTGRALPDPAEVAEAARAGETATDPRIASQAGILGIQAEMAIKAQGAADGPTRLGEMAAGAIQLRLACVRARYS